MRVSKKFGPVLSRLWTKVHEIFGQCRRPLVVVNALDRSRPHTNWGPQNHLFGPTSQLKGKFNRLYLRNGTRYRQSGKDVGKHEGSPTSYQNNMNFGPQTASNSTAILPTLRKFCCLLHCQALQTDTSKRNSTKLCQMVDSKLRQQSAVEKSGSLVPKNWGPKNFNIC